MIRILFLLLAFSFGVHAKYEEYKWIAPNSTTDVRSPCPMLNSLANHGFLNRDGRNITRDDLFDLTTGPMKMSFFIANFLIDQATKLGRVDNGVWYIDLDNLSAHNEIEHDASMSRLDFQEGQNVHVKFNEQRFKQMYDFAATDKDQNQYVTARHLGKYQKYLRNLSKQENINSTLDFKRVITATAEAAVLFIEFRDEHGRAPMSQIERFFKYERLYFEEGWDFQPVNAGNMIRTVSRVYFRI